MPRIYVAGSGWVAMVVVGVAGLMLAVIFGKHKKSQNKSNYETNISDNTEMSDVEMKDDTKIVNNADSSESIPILQNMNKENTL